MIQRKVLLVVFMAIAIGAVYFVWNFRVGVDKNTRIYTMDNAPDPREPGRVYQEFVGQVPPAFPKAMPIERQPLRIVKSYAEFMEGDADEGELRHAQYTYAYTTQKDGKKIASEFAAYFKNEQYSVEKTEAEDKLSYLVHAEKGQEIIANTAVVTKNQFERLVTVSLIFIERIPVEK